MSISELAAFSESDDTENSQLKPLISKDRARALNHRAELELGEKPPTYGVVLSHTAHFSHFPLAKVSGTEWVRQNTWGTIAIDAGRILLPGGATTRAAVPAGGLPRLLTAYITTEARRVHAKGGDPSRLDLTDSVNDMIAKLGLKKGSRNNAIMRALEDTLTARVTFSREQSETRNGRAGKWCEMMILPSIATELRLWMPESTPLEGFEPFIKLSDDYLKMILDDELVLPARLDILAQLAGKPMAMDILLWLQNTIYSLHRARLIDRFFTWEELYSSMTHDYTTIKNFVTRWKRALAEAQNYYPEARVEIVRGNRNTPGGVKVLMSPLLVNEKRRRIS